VKPVGPQLEAGLVLVPDLGEPPGALLPGGLGPGVEGGEPVRCRTGPAAFDAGKDVAVVSLGTADLGGPGVPPVLVQGVEPVARSNPQQLVGGIRGLGEVVGQDGRGLRGGASERVLPSDPSMIFKALPRRPARRRPPRLGR